MSVNTSDKRQRITQFLKDNYRKMNNPEFYFSIDDNKDSVDKFNDSNLKVLCVFLSTGATRSVSNTFNALNHLVHKNLGDNVFVDNCYFPEKENMELFDKNDIPYFFGCTSHAPIEDYDLVLMAVSIIPECLNIPIAWKGSNIPLTIEGRDNKDMPLVVAGGAALNELSIVLGPIDHNGEKGKSLVDISMYGYGERNLTELVDYVYKKKQEGFNLHDRKALRESMINDNLLHDYLFFPEYYDWVYADDNFTIKEIKKLDDRLPDRVKYNRIRFEFDGFPLKTFNLDGTNSDSHDIQISSGCTGMRSSCSFCMEGTMAGNYHERELVKIVEDMIYVQKTSAINTISYYSYNLNYYSHFMDLLLAGANHFKGLTLLNER